MSPPPMNPALSRLVERQMLNWEISRTQREAQDEETEESVQDFICVSRQVGVADWNVASALGERLSWPVFGRELLDAMSGDDDIRRRVYDSMDQRDLGWIEKALRPFFQADFGRNDYLRRLCETMLSLARQGNCVVVGRGGDLIMPRASGFRVRLVATLEERIDYVAETRGVSREQAASQIRSLEKGRADFVRHNFGVEPDDPSRFDIMIHLGRLSAKGATDLIVEARRIFGEVSRTQ